MAFSQLFQSFICLQNQDLQFSTRPMPSMASEKESRIGSVLPSESIKVIAESIGVSGLPDEAASFLAEDISYRLKLIVQVSVLQGAGTSLH